MIIDLQNDTCCDVIKAILTDFGEHTYEEIQSYFPTLDNDYILDSVNILLYKEMITRYESNNQVYYKNNFRNQKIRQPEREDYKKPLDFFRMMLNSVDDEGYLKNDIPFLCKGGYPCALYFQCNNSLYDIYYIPEEKISPMTALIKKLDSAGNIENDNCRIVITDNIADFAKITIDKIKYKVVIEPNGTLSFC